MRAVLAAGRFRPGKRGDCNNRDFTPQPAAFTGAGVSFCFGRTAIGVLGGTALLGFFGGGYAKLGRVTSLIYAIGLIFIWFAPIRSNASIED